MITKMKSLLQFYRYDIHVATYHKRKNTLHVTGASCVGSFLVASGKLGMGICSISFFTCVSALYSFAIVLAKLYVLYGISQTSDHMALQYEYYKRSGKLLVVAGSAYMLYAIRLLLFPTTSQFDQNTALVIALVTFVELGLNIRGIIVERKNKMPLFHALKIINLASACICLVLTQTALLSYTSMETGVAHDASKNGLIGIAMGFISTMLGVYLVIRGQRIQAGEDCKQVCKKIQRYMKKHNISYSFQPVQIYMENNGKRVLEVCATSDDDCFLKEEICHDIEQTLHVAIVEIHDTIKKREK